LNGTLTAPATADPTAMQDLGIPISGLAKQLLNSGLDPALAGAIAYNAANDDPGVWGLQPGLNDFVLNALYGGIQSFLSPGSIDGYGKAALNGLNIPGVTVDAAQSAYTAAQGTVNAGGPSDVLNGGTSAATSPSNSTPSTSPNSAPSIYGYTGTDPLNFQPNIGLGTIFGTNYAYSPLTSAMTNSTLGFDIGSYTVNGNDSFTLSGSVAVKSGPAQTFDQYLNYLTLQASINAVLNMPNTQLQVGAGFSSVKNGTINSNNWNMTFSGNFKIK
jgi:hypothetical protein